MEFHESRLRQFHILMQMKEQSKIPMGKNRIIFIFRQEFNFNCWVYVYYNRLEILFEKDHIHILYHII